MTSKTPPKTRRRVQIRALSAADIPACAQIVADTPLWQRYGYGRDRCATDLQAALARADDLHVASAGTELLGLAWVLPRGGFGRTPYLKLLAVSEQARNRGIGPLLLRAAEQRGELLLLVSDFNRAARRFYLRQGYRRLGALPDYVLPGVAEVILHRRITPSRHRRPAR